eukprot:GILK01005410.1.p1 GENE.GILK01005410.1~~GILK01005410.1.p1  ORF type:complete len:738 (-),score=130.52 GILK01005410.1:228-2381(-)
MATPPSDLLREGFSGVMTALNTLDEEDLTSEKDGLTQSGFKSLIAQAFQARLGKSAVKSLQELLVSAAEEDSGLTVADIPNAHRSLVVTLDENTFALVLMKHISLFVLRRRHMSDETGNWNVHDLFTEAGSAAAQKIFIQNPDKEEELQRLDDLVGGMQKAALGQIGLVKQLLYLSDEQKLILSCAYCLGDIVLVSQYTPGVEDSAWTPLELVPELENSPCRSLSLSSSPAPTATPSTASPPSITVTVSPSAPANQTATAKQEAQVVCDMDAEVPLNRVQEVLLTNLLPESTLRPLLDRERRSVSMEKLLQAVYTDRDKSQKGLRILEEKLSLELRKNDILMQELSSRVPPEHMEMLTRLLEPANGTQRSLMASTKHTGELQTTTVPSANSSTDTVFISENQVSIPSPNRLSLSASFGSGFADLDHSSAVLPTVNVASDSLTISSPTFAQASLSPAANGAANVHTQLRDIDVLLLGPPATGKTYLVEQFKRDLGVRIELMNPTTPTSPMPAIKDESVIDPLYRLTQPTVGVDANVIRLDEMRKIKILDSSGQPRYQQFICRYYPRTRWIFVVYDVTRRQTFEHCAEWLKSMEGGGVSILLVGNTWGIKHNVREREVDVQDSKLLAVNHFAFALECCDLRDALEIVETDRPHMDTLLSSSRNTTPVPTPPARKSSQKDLTKKDDTPKHKRGGSRWGFFNSWRNKDGVDPSKPEMPIDK